MRGVLVAHDGRLHEVARPRLAGLGARAFAVRLLLLLDLAHALERVARLVLEQARCARDCAPVVGA